MNFTFQHIKINILEKQIDSLVQEHSSSDKQPPVYNHLLEWEHFYYVVNLLILVASNNSVAYLEHVKFQVYENTKIIGNCQNSVELCF